jgi:hypothetical protein
MELSLEEGDEALYDDRSLELARLPVGVSNAVNLIPSRDITLPYPGADTTRDSSGQLGEDATKRWVLGSRLSPERWLTA